MHARKRSFKLDPGRMDAAVAEFKQDHLPKFRHQKGYKGFTLLGNHKNGDVTGVSLWDTEDDMKGADEIGKKAGEAMLKTGHGTGDNKPDEWEVLVDDIP